MVINPATMQSRHQFFGGAIRFLPCKIQSGKLIKIGDKTERRGLTASLTFRSRIRPEVISAICQTIRSFLLHICIKLMLSGVEGAFITIGCVCFAVNLFEYFIGFFHTRGQYTGRHQCHSGPASEEEPAIRVFQESPVHLAGSGHKSSRCVYMTYRRKILHVVMKPDTNCTFDSAVKSSGENSPHSAS